MAVNTGRAQAMTWRCLACGAVYVDPLESGVQAPHVCDDDMLRAAGHDVPALVRRDENVRTAAPLAPAQIRSAGLGRVLVGYGDQLKGASIARLLELRQAPPIGVVPWPEAEPYTHARLGYPRVAE